MHIEIISEPDKIVQASKERDMFIQSIISYKMPLFIVVILLTMPYASCKDTGSNQGQLLLSLMLANATDPSGAMSIRESGNDIFASGYYSDGLGNLHACYWKNDTRYDLPGLVPHRIWQPDRARL